MNITCKTMEESRYLDICHRAMRLFVSIDKGFQIGTGKYAMVESLAWNKYILKQGNS